MKKKKIELWEKNEFNNWMEQMEGNLYKTMWMDNNGETVPTKFCPLRIENEKQCFVHIIQFWAT